MAWDGNPEQLVRDEYLWALAKPTLGNPLRKPGVTLLLDHPADHECHMVNSRICFTGAILKDGDLIYRIGEYDLETNCWHARWPD